MTNPFPILLDLGDGREPIPCRDQRQAEQLRAIYYAATTTHEQRQADQRRKMMEEAHRRFLRFPSIVPPTNGPHGE
jgi:conjugal transfer/entry exclusion protein